MTMADHPRATRLAERIQEIVARMLDTRVKDPRLGFVTITDVRVSGDLQHATLFYTVFGTDEEREGTAAALRSATGMLRREVGRQTGVRLTPTLEFIADAVPENARIIERGGQPAVAEPRELLVVLGDPLLDRIAVGARVHDPPHRVGHLLGPLGGRAGAHLVDERELDRVEAIIHSMTPWERRHPEAIKGSRRLRIAKGSGTSVQQVNQLVKQFGEMRKLMRGLSQGKMPDLGALMRQR